MKTITAMVFALLTGCSYEHTELPTAEHSAPITGPCSVEDIGLPCERDDNLVGVCVSERHCLLECVNDSNCEPYTELRCEFGFCR